MKKVLKLNNTFFVTLFFFYGFAFAQHKKHLKIELRKQIKTPYITIENITSDTIILFTKLKVEEEKVGMHILGYKKESKDYTFGVLKSCYHCIDEYFYLGNTENTRIRIPPKTGINTYLPFLYQGKYYFKIQTIYSYRGNTHLWNVKTNKIKVKNNKK